jgi:hypothetical protein
LPVVRGEDTTERKSQLVLARAQRERKPHRARGSHSCATLRLPTPPQQAPRTLPPIGNFLCCVCTVCVCWCQITTKKKAHAVHPPLHEGPPPHVHISPPPLPRKHSQTHDERCYGDVCSRMEAGREEGRAQRERQGGRDSDRVLTSRACVRTPRCFELWGDLKNNTAGIINRVGGQWGAGVG